MSKEIKDIPAEEIKRMQEDARIAASKKGIIMTREDFYMAGAKAEYLRHLSGNGAPAKAAALSFAEWAFSNYHMVLNVHGGESTWHSRFMALDGTNGITTGGLFNKYSIKSIHPIPSSEPTGPKMRCVRHHTSYQRGTKCPECLKESISSEPAKEPQPEDEVEKLRGLLLEIGVRAGIFLPTEEWLIDLFDIGFKGCFGLFVNANELLYAGTKDIQEQTRPHIPPEYKLDEGDEFIEKHLKNIKSLRAEYAEKFPLPPSPPSVDKFAGYISDDDKKSAAAEKFRQSQEKFPPSLKPEREDKPVMVKKAECTCIYGPTDANPNCTYPNCFKPEQDSQPSPTPPAVQQEDGEVPEEIAKWIESIHDGRWGFRPGAVAMYLKTQQEIAQINEYRKEGKRYSEMLEEKLTGLDKECSTIRQEKEDYRTALECIKQKAGYASFFMDISSEVLDKYPPQTPTK